MSASFRYALHATFILLLSAVVAPAVAQTCNPARLYVRSVGDVASDTRCTHDDIQSAIDGACPGTTIYVTREHLYTQQRLVVANRSVTLVGLGNGIGCPGDQPPACLTTPCGAVPTAPLVLLDGSNSGRVLTITGNSHVTLRYFTLRNGRVGADDSGGAIAFAGAGSLTLDTTTVRDSYAGYGGGINVAGSGGTAVLRLERESLVLGNVAQHSGGGIRLEGAARLLALAPRTYIAQNAALGRDPGTNAASGGYGGGIEVIGPAQADIASPGYNGAAVVSGNEAVYGGGISINGASSGALARLFSTDANAPVAIAGNFASSRGGGVYLRPDAGDAGGATLCAFDFRLADNVAPDGAALFLDWDEATFDTLGSHVFVNDEDPAFGTVCRNPEAPTALGAVACAPGVACNEIADHAALDAASTPTDGAIVVAGQDATFLADRLVLRGNRARSLLRVGIGDHPYAGFRVRNALVAGNHTTGALVRAFGDTYFDLTNATLVANLVDAGSVFHTSGNRRFGVFNAIVDHAGPVLDGDSAGLAMRYVLATDAATLPVARGVLQGSATFVDRAGGDYRLAPSSLGIDMAPALEGTDLARAARSVDLGDWPNYDGPVDLGAYELQSAPANLLFANGFE